VQASLHYKDKIEEIDPISVSEAKGNQDVAIVIAELETEMLEAAENLRFEQAALLRDQIDTLRKGDHLNPQSKGRGRRNNYGRKNYSRKKKS
jgi:excinuclease ABC subunit B